MKLHLAAAFVFMLSCRGENAASDARPDPSGDASTDRSDPDAANDDAGHWVGTWGGGDASFTTALKVATDASGNAYVIGTFGPTADFDPRLGVVSKLAMPPAAGTDGPARDAYLLKLDARHELAWVRTWGGSAYDYATDVAVDANGNVFVAGYFYSDSASVTFDPPAAGFEAKGAQWAESTAKAYVLKYDAKGAFQWARAWAADASSVDADSLHEATFAFGVTVDEGGNVYVVGDYDGAVDFDGTEGTDVHEANADGRVYLASYTTSGAYRWARTFGNGRAESVASDTTGAIAMTGYASGVADWDPSSGILVHGNPDEEAIFTSRFLTDGTFQWCRFVDGKGHANAGRSIVADRSGNVYVAGAVGGDDDGGTTDVADVVLLEYAMDGSSAWRVGFGAAFTDVGLAVALDPTGRVALSGIFEGTVDFDPGSGVALRTAAPQSFFVAGFSSSGVLEALTTGGPAVGSGGLGLAFDQTSHLYVAGTFWGTADFDPGEGLDTRTSVGSADAFLWYLRLPPLEASE